MNMEEFLNLQEELLELVQSQITQTINMEANKAKGMKSSSMVGQKGNPQN